MKKAATVLLTLILLTCTLTVNAMSTSNVITNVNVTTSTESIIAYPDQPTELSAEDEQKVIDSVKQLVNIPEGYTYATVSQYQGDRYQDGMYGKDNAYTSVYFSYDDMSIDLQLNSDGNVTSYNKYVYYNNTNIGTARRLPTVSREQAIAAAEAFLGKAFPQGGGLEVKLNLTESMYSNVDNNSYFFDVNAFVHGIRLEYSGTMSVDATTGEVTRYYMYNNITASEFPEPEGIITDGLALDIMKRNGLSYRLAYIQDYNSDQNVARLMYVPSDKTYNLYIDAFTGEPFDLNEFYQQMAELQRATEAEDEQTSDAQKAEQLGVSIEKYYLMVAAGEIAAPTATAAPSATATTYYPELDRQASLDGSLTVDQLELFARAIPSTVLNEQFELVQANFYDDVHSMIKTCYLVFNDEAEMREVYVSLDAETGALLSFNTSYSGLGNDDTQHPTDEVAFAVADQWLKQQIPEFYSRLSRYTENDSVSTFDSARFLTFIERVDGVPFSGNYVNIAVNKDELIHTFYYYEVKDITFEPKQDLISAEQLNEILKRDISVSLYYIDLSQIKAAYGVSEGEDYKLVYRVNNMLHGSLMYDAKTGEPYNPYVWGGSVFGYTDVEGTKYQKEIDALANIGIGFQSGQFEPDKQITAGEFLSFVLGSTVNFSYYGNPNNISADELQKVINQFQIVDGEINLDDSITRIDAVYYLLNTHMLNRALQYNNMFNVPYVDKEEIEQAYHGYAALAGQIPLVEIQDDKFEPNKVLTRGEAAFMIYNFLTQ